MTRIYMVCCCYNKPSIPTVLSMIAARDYYLTSKRQGKNAVMIDFVTGGYGIALSRNMAVRKANERGATHILFVDADIEIPPNTIEQLLECEADVAFGWYIFSTGNTSLAVFKEDNQHYDKHSPEMFKETKGQRIIDVDAGGFGCTLVKLEAFTLIPFPYFQFQIYSNGTYLSEDLYCCDQLRHNKVRTVTMKVNKLVRCTHEKTVKMRGEHYD